MKFYSYDYVLSQISSFDWLVAISVGILLVLGSYVLFKYYRERKDSKYRELAIIIILSIALVCLIQVSQFQHNQASDNQNRTSLHFIEVVSEQLKVDKSEVYVNTSAATDGAIVKVKDQFYRAISGNDPDTYLLEKMDLYKADVTLVEVEK